MNQWRIKTKRDWGIAAVFVFLISYLAAGQFQSRINDWLMKYSPEKMGYFNQPEHHGVYMLAVYLAAIFGTGLWIWQRWMSRKKCFLGAVGIWAAAIAAAAGIWCSYQAECRQIIRTPYDTALEAHVDVQYWGVQDIGGLWELTEEEERQIEELCLNLQALPEAEQEQMRDLVKEEDQISIHLRYPEYKNHSYTLWFFLEGDYLCLNRGHTKEDAVFYDGSELRVLLESMAE